MLWLCACVLVILFVVVCLCVSLFVWLVIWIGVCLHVGACVAQRLAHSTNLFALAAAFNIDHLIDRRAEEQQGQQGCNYQDNSLLHVNQFVLTQSICLGCCLSL